MQKYTREIKFRAWDELSSTMLDAGKFELEQTVDNGFIAFRHHDNGDYVELIPFQYTGLTDKNGVEIYEGDIMKGYVHDIHALFYVKYYADIYSCSFVATNNEDCNPYVNIWYEGFEVIGNIYENPELLLEAR